MSLHLAIRFIGEKLIANSFPSIVPYFICRFIYDSKSQKRHVYELFQECIFAAMSQKKPKHFGTYIDRNYRIIRLRFLRAFKEAEVDLTTEQWVLIDSLYKKNGLSQNELAGGSFKDAPTVSRIVDLLCKKGYTERQRFENDRRRYKIFLTDEGKAVYEKILPSVEGLREKGWENLSEEDYTAFLRIMNQVFENFKPE